MKNHACAYFGRSRQHWAIFASGLVSILLIGLLDYYTGPRISSSLFYLLPILYITHNCDRRSGVIAALLATGLWLFADLIPPTIYNGVSVPCWNALMRLGVFLIAVWLVSSMRELNETLEQRVAERTEQLQREAAERSELEKLILEISEREQARLGHDLHDGLSQHLVGTAFAANILQQQLADKGLPEAADMARIANLLNESITHARQLARGLYPVRVEDLGLIVALEELAESAANMYNVKCDFILTGEPPRINQLTAVHLYRIAQEAVANAMKHARPNNVWIRLRSGSGEFQLLIDDDGAGIPANLSSGKGLGLKIMEFRTRLVGGRLQIKRRVNGGTTVICVMPEAQVDDSVTPGHGFRQ